MNDSDAPKPHSGSHDCYVAPLTKVVDPERISGRAVARLALDGLGCPNCAARVRNALLALDGVIDAEVDLRPQRATVTYDPTHTAPEQLAETVYWAGAASRHHYRAEIIDVEALDHHPGAPQHPH